MVSKDKGLQLRLLQSTQVNNKSSKFLRLWMKKLYAFCMALIGACVFWELIFLIAVFGGIAYESPNPMALKQVAVLVMGLGICVVIALDWMSDKFKQAEEGDL